MTESKDIDMEPTVTSLNDDLVCVCVCVVCP